MMFTLYLTRANKWRSFSVFSKVVSVDHNKPIIVPVGQDSFQQIGERQEGKLLVLFYCLFQLLFSDEKFFVSFVLV